MLALVAYGTRSMQMHCQQDTRTRVDQRTFCNVKRARFMGAPYDASAMQAITDSAPQII